MPSSDNGLAALVVGFLEDASLPENSRAIAPRRPGGTVRKPRRLLRNPSHMIDPAFVANFPFFDGGPMQNKYGFGKTVALSYADALAKVTQELQKEGFGVLTEIDVKATLKKELDKDVPPYIILGACNPPFAARALDAEPSIGLLMPCNVVVRQDAQGAVHVEFLDPIALFEMTGRPEVAPLAQEVRARLERVMAAL
jgi:uncharacterized protein (DUF302 family)